MNAKEIKAAAERWGKFTRGLDAIPADFATKESTDNWLGKLKDHWDAYPGGLDMADSDKVTLSQAYLDRIAADESEQAERAKSLEGTSTGCRWSDGHMWAACNPEPDKKPGIAICEHAGNYINPALYKLVAVFERVEDRDLVLALHKAAVRIKPEGE